MKQNKGDGELFDTKTIKQGAIFGSIFIVVVLFAATHFGKVEERIIPAGKITDIRVVESSAFDNSLTAITTTMGVYHVYKVVSGNIGQDVVFKELIPQYDFIDKETQLCINSKCYRIAGI